MSVESSPRYDPADAIAVKIKFLSYQPEESAFSNAGWAKWR